MSASNRHPTRANKGFAVADKRVGVRVQPTVNGIPAVKPDGDRGSNAGSTQRAAKSSTVKGEKFTGKMSPAMAAKTLDFAITAYKVCNGLSYVRDVRANLLAQDAAGVDIPPELQGKVEECWRAACAAVQQVLAQCNGLARENEAEKTAAAQAAQAEVVPTAESVAAGEEDDTMETNSGQVPHSGATSGALDAAATDAGRKAILAHAQSVSSLHVPTVDAATRLQIEQANARKQSLQRAIANGDELEAIRLRFGLDRTTSTDPVGDFMRALKG